MAKIIVSALVPERREPALLYGATRVVDPLETDIASAGLGADSFVDASGTPRAVFSGIFHYTDTRHAGIHLVSSGQVDLDSLVAGRFDLDHVEDELERDLDPASLKSIVYPNR